MSPELTGFAIFLSGNELDSATNQTVIASDVLQEFEIAKLLRLYPIPVGGTFRSLDTGHEHRTF